jgi:hypothetical protein
MQTHSRVQNDKDTSGELSLSAIGKAFAQADLNMVHEILQVEGYNEDDIANCDVSYQFASKPRSYDTNCCHTMILYYLQIRPFQLCQKNFTVSASIMFCM